MSKITALALFTMTLVLGCSMQGAMDICLKDIDTTSDRVELRLVGSDAKWAGHLAFISVDRTIEYVSRGGMVFRNDLDTVRAIEGSFAGDDRIIVSIEFNDGDHVQVCRMNGRAFAEFEASVKQFRILFIRRGQAKEGDR